MLVRKREQVMLGCFAGCSASWMGGVARLARPENGTRDRNVLLHQLERPSWLALVQTSQLVQLRNAFALAAAIHREQPIGWIDHGADHRDQRRALAQSPRDLGLTL